MSNQFRDVEPTTRQYLETLAAQNDPPLSETPLTNCAGYRRL